MCQYQSDKKQKCVDYMRALKEELGVGFAKV